MRYLSRALATLVLLTAIISTGAWAQTCPATNSTPKITAGGNVFGRIAAQWNAYFGAKVDVNDGVLCNPTILGTLDVTFNNLTIGGALSSTSLTVTSNTITALPNLGIGTVRFGGADGTGHNVGNFAFGGNSGYVTLRANGIAAAPTALITDDLIGVYGTGGYNGTAWAPGTGGTAIWARENWTPGANGTYLSLDTLSNGTIGAASHRLEVHDGVLILGLSGRPTGGDLGPGTLNVAGTVAINGVPLASTADVMTVTASNATLPGARTNLGASVAGGIWPASLGGTGAGTLTGLVLGNGTSPMSAYAGASCTNQFPRSLSASGVATCATVGSADLASSLTLTSPTISGTLTFPGVGATTWDSTGLRSNNFTWNGLNDGANTQPTFDFYDLSMDPTATSTGVAMRFFGRQQNLASVEGAVINCGLKITTTNATKGDCDIVVYGWDGATLSALGGVAIDGELLAFEPLSNNSWDLGTSGQGWRDLWVARSVYLNASAGSAGQVPISAGAGAAVTWGSPAVTSQIVAGTFDLTTANGAVQNLTFGFTPSSCDGHGAINNGSNATYISFHAHSASAGTQSNLYGHSSAQVSVSSTTFFNVADATGSNVHNATISYSANTATLTWAKSGTPTGTFAYSVRCNK